MDLNTVFQKISTFHNSVKRDLIYNAAACVPYKYPSKPSVLIDLACGRGGDIHKCFNANYEKVIGFDKHEPSINNAMERYLSCYKNQTKNAFRAVPFNVHYFINDIESQSELILHATKRALNSITQEQYTFHRNRTPSTETEVDTVIMNYALNYFFKSSETLHTLLNLVSTLLKVGGMFTGIAIDGERLRKVLNHESKHENEIYQIEILETKLKSVYGHKYAFGFMNRHHTNDQQPHYFEFINEPSIEYMIDIAELIRVAKIYNLHVLETNYITTTQLNEHNEIFYLNFTFRFEKIRTYIEPTLPSVPIISNIVTVETPIETRPSNTILPMLSMTLIHDYFPKVSNYGINYANLQLTTESLHYSSRQQGSAFLVKLISKYRQTLPSFIMDGTANIGTDTISMAIAFPTTCVIAVEHEITNARALRNNIETYLLNNVQCYLNNVFCCLHLRAIDILYIDAPWGLDYKKKDTIDRLCINDPHNKAIEIYEIMELYHTRISMFVFKVPNNYTIKPLTIPNKTLITEQFKVRNVIKFKFLIIC
uniref:mRNA (guanine-N(7))-methyltransferase n=1 Tax=viral metagenome TaxID=1070528 RepID=A0A6C0CRN7_9ZZZZ